MHIAKSNLYAKSKIYVQKRTFTNLLVLVKITV